MLRCRRNRRLRIFLWPIDGQLVASMNAATTVGRHPLSSRFTATVRIGVLDYPDGSELCSVYSAFLGRALGGGGVSTDARCELVRRWREGG